VRTLDACLADAPKQMSCASIDIDHSKQVNDTRVHLIGDQVHARLGALISASVRDSDLAARYGGEEFVIVLPDTDSVTDFDTRVGTMDVAILKLRVGTSFPNWLLERRRRAEAAHWRWVLSVVPQSVSLRHQMDERTTPWLCGDRDRDAARSGRSDDGQGATIEGARGGRVEALGRSRVAAAEPCQHPGAGDPDCHRYVSTGTEDPRLVTQLDGDVGEVRVVRTQTGAVGGCHEPHWAGG
jgi:GGDEF domain-containing protein